MKHISEEEFMNMRASSGKMTHLQGVGVDLVGRKRLEKFLKSNSKSQCQRLLSDSEKKLWQKSEYSSNLFAKLFAAKEAYFKALGRDWLGVDGFSHLEIEICNKSSFTARDLHKQSGNQCKVSGSFFETNDMVGAQAIVWES